MNSSTPSTVRRFLLACGIISSLLYVFMNVYIPTQYPGYNMASQTVSELSAIDAPTRTLWVSFGIIYSILLIAFGWGVWQSGKKNRLLKIAGIALIIEAFVGMFWPPMHQRQVLAAGGGTLTDTLHIVWTFITVPLMMLVIGLAAAAFGKTFRWYSIITIPILMVFGILTGMDSPRMEANLATPLMGVWERIGIGANVLWVMVFSAVLFQAEKQTAGTTQSPRIKRNNISMKREHAAKKTFNVN